MTSSSAALPRTHTKALLPWIFSLAAQQWKAWKAARRLVRADELTWNMALQDARLLADLSRAMSDSASEKR